LKFINKTLTDVLSSDVKKTEAASSLVRARLESELKKDDIKKIDELTFEELQDFDKVLKITLHTLYKYENKRQVYKLLKEFVDILQKSSTSVEDLDDQIQEMILSAEYAITHIKDLQGKISNNYSLCGNNPDKKSIGDRENGSNNLTKSSIAIYHQEYQQKTRVKIE
jgi:hypothetical protein